MRKRFTGGVAVIALALVMLAMGAGGGSAGTTTSYLVVYKGSTVAADAAASIQKAGGTLVYSYKEIGVALASSDSNSFRANLLNDAKVDDVGSTAGLGYQLPSLNGDAQA